MTPTPAWRLVPGTAERARELWDAGVSARLMALELGTTKDSIIGYCHRRGFPPRPSPIRRGAAAPKPVRAKVVPIAPAPEPVPVYRRCQWLHGDERRTWRFCEAPVASGRVYCQEHAARCYLKPGQRTWMQAA